MKKRALASALLEAIREANDEYQYVSGGSWLSDYGAESFLVYHLLKKGFGIARETSPNACATVEESIETIAQYSGADKKRGPLPAVLSGNFRVDIAFWKDPGQPYGAVEVKKKWDGNLCLNDIRRLEALMDRCGEECSGTLKFASLAVFLARANDPEGQKLRDHYEHIKNYLNKKAINPFRFHYLEPKQYDYVGLEDFFHYSAGGVLIELY